MTKAKTINTKVEPKAALTIIIDLSMRFYLQNSGIAVGIFFAVLFLLFMPFPILAYSITFFDSTNSFFPLFIISIVSSLLIYIGAIVETKGLFLKFSYAFLCPIGSFIVVGGFLSGILYAKSDVAVLWRGRTYSMKEHAQSSIQVQ